MTAPVLWIDGKLVPEVEGRVPFLTSSLHYGIGAFEGIRCYRTSTNPAIFRLREHLRRLARSCAILGLRLPFSEDVLANACVELVARSGLSECYVRPLVYTGETLKLGLADAETHVGIAARPFENFLAERAVRGGIRLLVSSYVRQHPNAAFARAKATGTYAMAAVAITDARRHGCDEAVMLDTQGQVCECTGANLFIVRDDTLIAPSSPAALEGITRDTVVRLAGDLGIRFVEQPLSRDQLYVADEVFICGTAVEVAAASEIDGRAIGGGAPGPVTAAIQTAFRQNVLGEGRHSAEWLTYVERSA